MNKLTSALDDATSALHISPTYFKALRTKGRVQVAQGHYEEAIGTFKSALQAAADGSLSDRKSLAEEVAATEAAMAKRSSLTHYEILEYVLYVQPIY